MSDIIKIKKGLDIRLTGEAERIVSGELSSTHFAVKPDDFHGLVPKLLVREGDAVKAGTALLCDKNCREILFTSPVSGTVSAIVRGEKRKLLEVVVVDDGTQESEPFVKADPLTLTRDLILEQLLLSGLWPLMIQRPYGIIANPKDTPKAIFVSAFDSAPLAPDYAFVLKDSMQDFQTGIDALSRLTPGKVHLSIPVGKEGYSVFEPIVGVELHRIQGPHPAGNVGVQIHHIDPVNKGDIVWVVNPQDVALMGRLFCTGLYRPEVTVAFTGAEPSMSPCYYKVIRGCCISALTAGLTPAKPLRYISGNVLTGSGIDTNGYLGFYDYQLSVLPEGNYSDFLGWMMPGLDKFSVSRSFLSWMMFWKKYSPDTHLNGAHRAFVFTGVYEKVVPMDIFPLFLLKAIMAGNIDLMEQLGIYEVIEEDLALCEVICPSKTEVQSILRKGLDMMVKEMS